MKKYLTSIVLGSLFVIFSLFVFLFNKVYEASFYISYFIVLAVLLLEIGINIFRIKASYHFTTLYPITLLTAGYFLLEMIIASIMIGIGTVHWKVHLCIQIPLFVIYLVIALILYASANHVHQNIKEIKEQTVVRNDLADGIRNAANLTTDVFLKDSIESLANDLHYSQISNKTSEFDDMIHSVTNQLKQALLSNDIEGAKAEINRLKGLVACRAQQATRGR